MVHKMKTFLWEEAKKECVRRTGTFSYWRTSRIVNESLGLPSKGVDSNVEKVVKQLRARAELGLQKYGVTTERTDLSFLEWLQHLQEELMDASIYIEKLKPGSRVSPPELMRKLYRIHLAD